MPTVQLFSHCEVRSNHLVGLAVTDIAKRLPVLVFVLHGQTVCGRLRSVVVFVGALAIVRLRLAGT